MDAAVPKSVVGSRVYAPGRATRKRILDNACRLMWERGVNATTLDDVRAASETSKSQLYTHFATKDDLVLGVVGAHSEVVLLRQEALLVEVDSFAGLQAWADELVRSKELKHGAYGCVIGTLANELADQNETARRTLEQAFTGWQLLIRGVLERMRDREDLRADVDLDRLSVGLLSALQGGYVLGRAAHDVRPMRDALAFALDHIGSFRTG